RYAPRNNSHGTNMRRLLFVVILLALVVGAITYGTRRGASGDRAATQSVGTRSAPTFTAVGSPSWSPDGKTIVFYSEHDGGADIFSMPVAGGSPRQLTQTRAS